VFSHDKRPELRDSNVEQDEVTRPEYTTALYQRNYIEVRRLLPNRGHYLVSRRDLIRVREALFVQLKALLKYHVGSKRLTSKHIPKTYE
jgi:hypothetical protein